MINEFIAVIAVFVVVNGFVLLILGKISAHLKSTSKNVFITRLNVYDDIIDSKINEIKTLEKKILELNSSENGVNRIVGGTGKSFGDYNIRQVADYTDSKFYENYRYLKDSFKLDYNNIVNEFIEQVLNKDTMGDAIYVSMLDKLDFDVKFTLLTKDEKSQLEYLKENFNAKENYLLGEFIKNQGRFNLLQFIEYLKNSKIMNSFNALVRVSKDLSNIDNSDKRLSFEVDEDILEGLKIIYKNKVYDYSFRR